MILSGKMEVTEEVPVPAEAAAAAQVRLHVWLESLGRAVLTPLRRLSSPQAAEYLPLPLPSAEAGAGRSGRKAEREARACRVARAR